MKISLVLTFLLLQIGNISSSTEIKVISISQGKCDHYRNMFQKPPTNKFPFLVRIYNGYYLNGNLIIENDVKFLNGVIVSEDFVLAYNGIQGPLLVEFLDMQFEVIQKIVNEQQNIMLLKLSESITFNDNIRPVCLAQPQPIKATQLICWVDNSWLSCLNLKLASRGSCKSNSENYTKRLRIKGVDNVKTFCTNVKGDRNTCNAPGSILLNDHQEVIGVATKSADTENPQIFVPLAEQVLWIENIVWTSLSTTTITTEQTFKYPSENRTDKLTTNVFAITSASTPNSNVTKHLGPNDVELHDIHIFLNVNLILIVVILFLVLCISTILWSDGLCIRAVLPHQVSTSTDV